jgi:hypothetical protein
LFESHLSSSLRSLLGALCIAVFTPGCSSSSGGGQTTSDADAVATSEGGADAGSPSDADADGLTPCHDLVRAVANSQIACSYTCMGNCYGQSYDGGATVPIGDCYFDDPTNTPIYCTPWGDGEAVCSTCRL